MKDSWREEFHKILEKDENYWRNKINWIDSVPNIKLNLLPDYRLTDEDYYKMRKEVRDIMELNMVMYGKW